MRKYSAKMMLWKGALALAAGSMMLAGCLGIKRAWAADSYQANAETDAERLGEVDLSDMLSRGGLGTPVYGYGDADMAGVYDAEKLADRIYKAAVKYETEVDVTDIGVTINDVQKGNAIQSALAVHPEILGMTGVMYYYNNSGIVTKIIWSFSTGAAAEQKKLNSAIAEVDKQVNIKGLSEEEIVLAYHEYLVSTTAYAYEEYLSGTLGGKHEYDMYGTLVNRSCVCQGYAETMFYFLRRAGLSCAIASSQRISHAWNIVKIGGRWYHVDATWDDPVWDTPGRSGHEYFLVSFATMNARTDSNNTGKNREDMVISAQWGDTYTSAVDKRFESGKFWNGKRDVLYYRDGYWYGMGSEASQLDYQIVRYNYRAGTSQVLHSGIAKWTTASGAYYTGQYGYMYMAGDKLYYSTPDSIYRIDVTSPQSEPVEIVNIRTKHNTPSGMNICAMGLQYGKLVYFVSDVPYVSKVKDSNDPTKYLKKYNEYRLTLCSTHSWNAGVVTKAPTYTSTGIKTYTCNNCGATKTETVAMLKLKKVTVKAAVVAKGIQLTWTPEENGTGYCVYKKNSSGSYTLIRKITSKDVLTITDAQVVSGKTYTYKVRAYISTSMGEETEVSKCYVGTAEMKVANAPTGIKLSWSKVGGVSAYKIYKRAGNGAWNCISTASGTVSTYLDKNVKPGITYTYLAKPYVGSVVGTYTKVAIAHLKPVAVKAKASKTGITLSWTKAGGSTEYRIYRKVSEGKYARVKVVQGANTLGWTDKGTVKGKTYYYYIRAFRGDSYSALSNVVTAKQ